MAQEFQLGAPATPEEPPVTEEDAHEEPTGESPNTVEDLPEWARTELKRARREAAKYRNQAKKSVPATDADTIRADIRREMMGDLAAARIEAALTGIVDDPSTIVEDLNMSRYITEDGEVDHDAIAALKKKYALLVKRPPSVGHGRTGQQPSATAADQFAATLRSLGA